MSSLSSLSSQVMMAVGLLEVQLRLSLLIDLSPPLSIEEDGFPVFVTDMYNSLHHSGRGVTSVYIVGDAIPRLIT
jgi:hypothetical protein